MKGHAVDTSSDPEYAERIERRGFAIVDGVISERAVHELRNAISDIPEGDEIRRRANVYGVRNLLDISSDVRALAASPAIRALVIPILGSDCFAVRATFFDKVPDANWKLRYHQDSVIAVKQRVETPGFSAWATKAGVLQVRPPEGVLLNMLAVRLHLDDCHKQNGPLRVLACSQSRQWSREEIESCRSRYQQVVCEVDRGGALVMRPLILHASSAAEIPEHRRVIHIEYAKDDLPGDLEWQYRI